MEGISELIFLLLKSNDTKQTTLLNNQFSVKDESKIVC